MGRILFDRMPRVIHAHWQAAPHVQAFTTTCNNGFSTKQAYQSFNLACSPHDDPHAYTLNRLLLAQTMQKPIFWLRQKHTNIVVEATTDNYLTIADASVTSQTDYALAVLTADCVPIVLCNKAGTRIAAIHAGWRGLANNIIANTIQQMACHDLMAWIGPCICWKCYPVGNAVRTQFCRQQPQQERAFTSRDQRWHADLRMISHIQLQQHGVERIYQTEYCTYRSASTFFSARRQGIHSGRMATCVWIDHNLC